MIYRPDIQILRGVSVLLVVIYHLQMGVLHSGFLGVDIFFVISGFLMAVLYTRSKMSHPFDRQVIVDFLSRRARRILPAYYITVLVVLVASCFVINPADFGLLTEHAVYAVFLVPNISFWLENSYFDHAHFRPLLHLWSLGVEIHFYLIIPIIFAIFLRSRKLLVMLGALSFLACIFLAGRSPNTIFFLLPTRLWEFMIGYLCARYLTHNGNVRVSDNAALPGWTSLLALLLLLTLCSIDFSASLPHTEWIAGAACLFAAIILVHGLPAFAAQSPIGKLLEKTGKYSYSVYLVHYPIILLVTYHPFSESGYGVQSGAELLVILIATATASVAMYHLVESPFRNAQHRLSRFTPLLICIAATLATVPLLKQMQHSQLDSGQLAIYDSVRDKTTFRCGVPFELLHPSSLSCSLTANNEDVASSRYLLIGNSHADSIKTALAESAARHGRSLRMWRHNYALGPHVPIRNVIRVAESENIEVVILHNAPDFFSLEETRELVTQAENLGFKVVLIDPIPTWDKSVPESVLEERFGQVPPVIRTVDDYYDRVGQELQAISSISSAAFERIEVADYFCNPECRKTDETGVPLYYDSQHLNLRGARILTPVFEQIFAN